MILRIEVIMEHDRKMVVGRRGIRLEGDAMLFPAEVSLLCRLETIIKEFEDRFDKTEPKDADAAERGV